MKSMLGMQNSTKIKEIQDKWKKKDPKRMQEEGYYTKNITSILPRVYAALIQMPILIALYRSLFVFDYVNPAHATFLVTKFDDKDPFILPVFGG